MSEPRIYQNSPLIAGQAYTLDVAASHHLARVLRAHVGDICVVFNGLGGEYQAVITAIDKRAVHLTLGEFNPRDVESPLRLCLAQGISRGEKMDYTIQKAVELGVHHIVPLLTERCNVKLDADRRAKRQAHWRAIIVSACEQSGRNTLPTLAEPQILSQWLPEASADYAFCLSPNASAKLNKSSLKSASSVILLVGPEGGLSESEIHTASAHGFTALNLGPRILRTETAAIAALTALQFGFGDLSTL